MFYPSYLTENSLRHYPCLIHFYIMYYHNPYKIKTGVMTYVWTKTMRNNYTLRSLFSIVLLNLMAYYLIGKVTLIRYILGCIEGLPLCKVGRESFMGVWCFCIFSDKRIVLVIVAGWCIANRFPAQREHAFLITNFLWVRSLDTV